MPKNEYKCRRFNIRVTDEDLAVIDIKRGSIPLHTYLTEIVHRFAKEQEKNKE